MAGSGCWLSRTSAGDSRGRLAVAGLGALAMIASSLTVATTAGAQAAKPANRPAVRMKLTRSVPPDPLFLVPGVCGVAVANQGIKCITTIIQAIDAARKTEPLPGLPSSFSITAFQKLTFAEQIFAVADIERTARGLAPIEALTSQLNAIAVTAAVDQTDPELPLPFGLHGGGSATTYGSNWAEGATNALGADYYWMYDDGTDSPNSVCQKSSDPGCWGHRENVLWPWKSRSYCPAGSLVNTVMGAGQVAVNVNRPPSIVEIFVNDCGKMPSDVIFTWQDVRTLVFGR